MFSFEPTLSTSAVGRTFLSVDRTLIMIQKTDRNVRPTADETQRGLMKLPRRISRFLLCHKRWCFAGLASLPALALIAWLSLPLVSLPDALFTPAPTSVELLDRNGESLRVIPSEAGYGRPVTEADIPANLLAATISAEDKRYFRHHGVDPYASLRAGYSLVRHQRVVSGGSTISQQLIKICEPRPRTFRTKFIEAIQALRLEQIWDKQRILSEYLNRLDYGNRQIGCANAAKFYFGKPVWNLTASEAALLAGLPQGPSRLNPFRHLPRAQTRQHWILERMHLNGHLDLAQLHYATNQPIQLVRSHRDFNAPHFCELALARIDPLAQPKQRRTTLDLELNREAQQILHRHVSALRMQNVLNGAAVVIHNPSGDVMALVGSQDYFSNDGGQINGAWTPRSPGSALKPFLYQMAFEQGFTPATILADVPTEFPTSSGIYRPVNYDRRHRGPVRARLALANSLNIPAVSLLQRIGGADVFKTRLNALQLSTINLPADHYGLGLAIGNPEVRLLELANAYACLARLGEYRPFRLYRPIDDTVDTTQLLDPVASYLVADILSDNDARAQAFGLHSPLNLGFKVACKTGTSSDFRDNWCIGYTPDFTVAVWVGNFNGSGMQNVSGISGAGPVMRDLMHHLRRRFGTSWYQRPPGIVEETIHPYTGKLIAPNTRLALSAEEIFDRRHEPNFLAQADFDVNGRTRLPGIFHEWINSSENHLSGVVTATPLHPSNWQILTPVTGTVFYLDADLPDNSRYIPLRTTGGGNNIRWHSTSLQCSHRDNGIYAELTPGTHYLTASHPDTGKELRTQIVVKRL